MSAESELQKEVIEMLIDRNPTSVKIKRTELTVEKGARKEKKTTLGPIDIGIFTQVPMKMHIEDQALIFDMVRWQGLAKSTADMQYSPNVHDILEIQNDKQIEGRGKLKVHSVTDIKTDGVLTGLLLSLELWS